MADRYAHRSVCRESFSSARLLMTAATRRFLRAPWHDDQRHRCDDDSGYARVGRLAPDQRLDCFIADEECEQQKRDTHELERERFARLATLVMMLQPPQQRRARAALDRGVDAEANECGAPRGDARSD